MKRVTVGTVRFDPRDATRDRGHDYGKGRAGRVMRHKNVRREKDRLRREINSW